MKVLVVQLCPTLYDSMECTLPGSCVHWVSQAKNTGVGCHTLLRGIVPTQGWNPPLLHWQAILYGLSYQGSPELRETGPSAREEEFSLHFPVVLFLKLQWTMRGPAGS